MKRAAKFIVFLLFLSFSFNSCKSESDDNIKSDLSKLNVEAKTYGSEDDVRSAEAIKSLNDSIACGRENAITLAVKKCSPAIVGINVTEVRKVEYVHPFFDDPFFRRFFGKRTPRRTREYEVKGLGSGFLISPNGYILSNHHVAGNAAKIVVTLTSGETYDAEIIGADKVSDVALLKIDGENLPYIKLGDSDDLIIGEWVIAMGNPFGLFKINAKPTVTVGVISNKGVDLYQDGRVYKKMIQTDAAISSGNSGGPLINALGEVIAMNTVIFSTAQNTAGAGSIGIGFAIPINRVKKIVETLKEEGGIDRNYTIGITVKKIDEEIARYLNTDRKQGVFIYSIQRGSPADEANFEPGDIILEIENKIIDSPEDYLLMVTDGVAGQYLKFKILRDGKKITKKLYLEPK